MKAKRAAVAKIERSLDRDRRVFAAPLLVIIVILAILLAYFSWVAANHVHINFHHVRPGFLLWSILGAAGFCMPVLSRLQRAKLDLIARVRAAANDLDAWKKESIAISANALQVGLAAAIAAAAAAAPRRSGEVFEAWGIPHICLTPRILAQRPIHTRVPRG